MFVKVAKITDGWYIVYGEIERRDVVDIDADVNNNGTLEINIYYSSEDFETIKVENVFDRNKLYLSFPIYTGRGTFNVIVVEYAKYKEVLKNPIYRRDD